VTTLKIETFGVLSVYLPTKFIHVLVPPSGSSF